jgi:hypothetical protein
MSRSGSPGSGRGIPKGIRNRSLRKEVLEAGEMGIDVGLTVKEDAQSTVPGSLWPATAGRRGSQRPGQWRPRAGGEAVTEAWWGPRGLAQRQLPGGQLPPGQGRKQPLLGEVRGLRERPLVAGQAGLAGQAPFDPGRTCSSGNLPDRTPRGEGRACAHRAGERIRSLEAP